jgi:hypothetical protein
MQWLADLRFESIAKNLALVPTYGRWDDILALNAAHLDAAILHMIRKALLEDQDGLLAKWMPRKGALANKLRKALGLDPKAYRKLLVELSATVEQKMCAGEWTSIAYSGVPSVAMNRYRKAFFRNDQLRFNDFIGQVNAGEVKINAGAIFPHEIYKKIVADPKGELKDAIVAQWNALPDYMADSNERILPVCDVSGSMSGLPMEVCIALGIYISERNRSMFKDAFITFSAKPALQYLKGSLYERVQQLQTADWGMNTDLEAVFRLVLDRAVAAQVSADEMPTKILIVSDMEFDQACQANQTALAMIADRYAKAGYVLPGIIFWNVRGRLGNVPAKATTQNVGLVSGFSPAILQAVLQGGNSFNPVSIMMKTIGSERYAAVTA